MAKRSNTVLYLMIVVFVVYAIAMLFYFNIIDIDMLVGNNKNVLPENDDPQVDYQINSTVTGTDSLWLHTYSDEIRFRNGTAITFHGVSIYEPYGMMFGAKWNYSMMAADCRELAQNWHANIIRVPVFPNEWNDDQVNNSLALDMLIQAANSNGLYVLIDWHAAGNPVTGEPMTGYPGWDPGMESATRFLEFVSGRYRENPMVLYGIFNEPGMGGLTWAQWRPLAETLVGVIRESNPQSLVMVPGVKFAYDLSGVSGNPVNDTNIVYETHIYPQSVSAQKMTWATSHSGLTGKYPVIVGEWGFTIDSGPDYYAYGTADSFGNPLMQFVDERGYSWIAWAWSPRLGQPSMLSSSQPGIYNRTTYGDFVYNQMRQESP